MSSVSDTVYYEELGMFKNPDHITLAVVDEEVAIEFFELLGFRRHVAYIEPGHRKRGFNHRALAVDDLAEATAYLESNGIEMMNEEMHYISRKVRYFRVPKGSPWRWSSASTEGG